MEAKRLRDGLQSPEDAPDHIIGEVDRLRGLVTDLNWLAETDHGELRLAFQPGSIRELLTTKVQRLQPQARARQVEPAVRASGDLPSMDLDRGRMNQALGNVLNNAIHSTDPGGNIDLSADLEDNRWPAISVTDDGTGVHPADLPHLFDRFDRTDRSRSRQAGGKGLGPAITWAIVEAHGGSVSVAGPGPGQGATVIIRLPLTSTKANTSSAPPDPN